MTRIKSVEYKSLTASDSNRALRNSEPKDTNMTTKELASEVIQTVRETCDDTTDEGQVYDCVKIAHGRDMAANSQVMSFVYAAFGIQTES